MLVQRGGTPRARWSVSLPQVEDDFVPQLSHATVTVSPHGSSRSTASALAHGAFFWWPHASVRTHWRPHVNALGGTPVGTGTAGTGTAVSCRITGHTTAWLSPPTPRCSAASSI